jgi:hypothetical protein
VLADRLKALLRAVQGSDEPEPILRPRRSGGAKVVGQPGDGEAAIPLTAPTNTPRPSQPFDRPSPGLLQFCRGLDTTRELRLLDLGGANSANIAFMTSLGGRLYSEDFFATLEDCFADGDYYENQRDPARVESFLVQTFSEQRGPFDGALVWDSFQFLRPSLLEKTVDHLHRILEPGAHILAYFAADEKMPTVPQYSFRIVDEANISITQRAEMPPGQPFSNRAIERLFEDFQSVKFFLSRDHIREVLIKR